MIKKKFLLLTVSTMFFFSSCTTAQPIKGTENIPALKEIFQHDFLIGTAMNGRQIDEKDTAADHLIKKHFSAVTPENIMKAGIIHPGWNIYNFELADKLVAYGQKNNIKINGHTLIWHSQLPDFMRHINDADSVKQFFTNHITTVASRYDGKIYSWDVVNEALEEDGTLRKSIFLEKLGPDYIIEAFRLAQKAAPHTKLYYNDYNIEQPKKRIGAVTIIKQLQAAGVRIDGIGIQGHWKAGAIPLKEIGESIKEFAALGIEVLITELDLDVLPIPLDDNSAATSNTVHEKMDPYRTGLPDSVSRVLTKGYADLFTLFLQFRKDITRITFWGVNDGQSWLNGWPVRGRTNYPLLFDRNCTPKAAFYKVIATKKTNN